MELKDYIATAILFITLFWMATLPIYNNPMPYGEGDAAFHFSVGDVGYTEDHMSWNYPDWWGWYSGINSKGHNYPQHPPTKQTSRAISPILGGERIVPSFIFVSLATFLVVFSIFFVIRKFFNTETAFLAAFMIIFAKRDILINLWGQNPSLFSASFIPITLYAFYKYLVSYFENKQKPIYIYLFVLLLASQYLIHLQAMVPSVLGVLCITIILSLKYKSFPMGRKNTKHILAGILLLMLIALPFIGIYTGTKEVQGKLSINGDSLHRLFYWFKLNADGTDGYGTPSIYFDYSKIYGWLMAFIIIGALYVLSQGILKKKDRFVVMAAWLVGLYLGIHLDVFGISKDTYRSMRMLSAESALFFSLGAIGVFFVINFVSKFFGKNYKKYVSYLLFALVIVAVSMTLGKAAYAQYNGAYPGLLRITPYQYEIAKWIDGNLPESASVHVVGPLTYPTYRFMNRIAKRFTTTDTNGYEYSILEENKTIEYLLIDYSGLIPLANSYPQFGETLNKIQVWENSIQTNVTLVYSGDMHKIYKIDDPYINNSGGIPARLI